MRVLIVDDEPLARAALARILAARPDVEGFDSAGDAIEAQQCLSTENYDVMLLDISMPEISGLELIDRLQRSGRPLPSVVLVTAYAHHAVTAFEKHAVDYILKPFATARVNQALEYACRRMASERAAKFVELMPHLRMLSQGNSSKVGIRSNGRILFVDPHDVLAAEAEGNYVLLRQKTGSHLLRESISTIAEKLKPYGFVRIHRSVLVNLSFVQELRPCPTGEYELSLKGGQTYTVTRTYKKNLKLLAYLWVGSGALFAD